MTIRPGELWGDMGELPPDVVRVGDDAALRAFASDRLRAGQPRRVPPLAPQGGDLWRSVGGRRGHDRLETDEQVALLPIDGLQVVLGTEEHWAFAHVVVRRSWWRGEVVAVMNAQHLGFWDVAPRAHPNDGKLDIVRVDPKMSVRTRWQARARLPNGTHVPHPQITTRQAPAVDLVFDRAMSVWLDGEAVGEHRHVVVTVVPDLLTICI